MKGYAILVAFLAVGLMALAQVVVADTAPAAGSPCSTKASCETASTTCPAQSCANCPQAADCKKEGCANCPNKAECANAVSCPKAAGTCPNTAAAASVPEAKECPKKAAKPAGCCPNSAAK